MQIFARVAISGTRVAPFNRRTKSLQRVDFPVLNDPDIEISIGIPEQMTGELYFSAKSLRWDQWGRISLKRALGNRKANARNVVGRRCADKLDEYQK
jgi:hypothetical protein